MHPTSNEAAKALAEGGDSMYRCVWPFTRLAVGDLDEFIDRWLGWFGDAAQVTSWPPPQLPEHDISGTWRRR